MCSYRKLKNLEQEDSKTITTMLREFIKIEFVIHNNSNQRKKKATEFTICKYFIKLQ